MPRYLDREWERFSLRFTGDATAEQRAVLRRVFYAGAMAVVRNNLEAGREAMEEVRDVLQPAASTGEQNLGQPQGAAR